MPRVNFRDVGKRFEYIDASLVGFSYRHDIAEGRQLSFSVSFYPGGEHPKVVDAIRRGKQWRIHRGDAHPERVVSVHAVGVRDFNLSGGFSVDEWAFFDDHPLLWGYEDRGQIICNGPFCYRDCAEIVESVVAGLGFPDATTHVWKHVAVKNIRRYGDTPPFALGNLPRRVYLAFREQLQLRGVEIATYREPEFQNLPVLFLIDGDDFIIAEDFELDVPEWEHRDEWITVVE